jgi:multidrug efflux pump subunit AcrB
MRQFILTNLSLENKNTIYLLVLFLVVFGFYSYRQLPKELFPDIVVPTVLVQTSYPGNPPVDMENLVTRPLEKEIEVIRGVKEIRSTSYQDISAVIIEFNTDVDIKAALQDVKDAVDNAKGELPDDLPTDPFVTDLDFSEFPIIYINLSGDYSINELKSYAEFLQDEIESITEISKVDIIGLNEREIKINVDQYKMEAVQISFTDIENAIGYENISMSAGQIRSGDTRRSLRIIGEFQTMDDIRDIIVKNEDGNIVYLKDIASVEDAFADPQDYARLNGQLVVSLHVIKKGGENLLAATDQIFELLDQSKVNGSLPRDLKVTLTNDQSEIIRRQLSELENSIIMGIILVILVLYFFLGTRSAVFVGLAIPLSLLVSFIIFSMVGYKINMILLFSLILALGMLVDDAIVVVENVFRFTERGYTKMEASRMATGEIAIPVITSTMTTLATFFPLVFWDSLMGEFMKILPITLIVTLASSLFVALVITPVMTSSFMKTGDQFPQPNRKYTLIAVTAMMILSVIFYVAGYNTPGTLLVLFALIGIANITFLNKLGKRFFDNFLPWMEGLYKSVLFFILRGKNVYYTVAAGFLLLLSTMFLLVVRSPKVVFFPTMDPQYINIMATLPIETDIEKTNRFMIDFEREVNTILQPHQNIVKSVLTSVGSGAKSENDMFDMSETPHKGMITVTFLEYELREGINTFDILKQFEQQFIGKYAGVNITVEKQSEGPPVGKPINIEITGADFDELITQSESMRAYIEKAGIQGIEGLNIDLDLGKPEAIIHIDRDRARRYGLSTGQIAMTIRTSLFGKEISDFKVGEDEYPIQLRLNDASRYNIADLMNLRITFRNQTNGQIVQVPISAVADISYSTTYGAVKRKDLDRMVTIYSNVLKGYNATEINTQLKSLLAGYPLPQGYAYKFTGEQEEQAESIAFLGKAMLIAVALIMVILVTQFNSAIKPLIILTTVILSSIGVFGGIATFKMDFVVIMTGIGLISLAGIVVKNAIVLIDYTDLLTKRKRQELGLEENAILPNEISKECIFQAGSTRLRPVLLTALTTILGLIPLAIGLNIDFLSLFEHLNPRIYFGGDNLAFWGPLSWTIIFGLTFSTFLTLLIVPALYQINFLALSTFHRLFSKVEK